MAAYRPIGVEVAAPTSSGTATDVSLANSVKVTNTATSVQLVTLTDADGATIGSMSLVGGETITIDKQKTQKLFAAANTVKFAPITQVR